MNLELKYDMLLADLYQGITTPERLESFLGRLCEASASHIGILQRQDLEQSTGSIPLIVGADIASASRYESEFADDNIWFERTKTEIRTGSAHFGEDRVTVCELKKTRYYNELLRLFDVEHSLGICAQLQGGRVAFISMCRSERSGVYNAEERALIRRITPHIANAFALLTQFGFLGRQIDAASNQSRAVFWLDAQLRWVGGNASAEQMLAAGWWLGRKGAKLEATHAITRNYWLAAQRALAKGALTHEQAIPVCDAKGNLVAFARLHNWGGDLACREGMPRHVLFVSPIRGLSDFELVPQLRALFKLTHAEAALATALHSHGDLAAAAVAVGIGRSGARTRLQSIFEKTNTHGQAELSRTLNALVDALT